MSDGRPATGESSGAGADDLLGGLLAELRRREPEAADRLLDLAEEAVGVARALLEVVARVLDEQRTALRDEAGGAVPARVQRIDIGVDAPAASAVSDTGAGAPRADSGTGT